MRKVFTLIIVLAILAVVGYISHDKLSESISSLGRPEVTMNITSTAFTHEGNIPSKYTCDEEDINPPLDITSIPEGTKSLALIMDDPDAPNGTWVHWIVYNIDPGTTHINENSASFTFEGFTSINRRGYNGPCPPSGTHRYFFKLYALDAVLKFDAKVDKTVLESGMANHVLATAELVGLYARN